MENGLAVIKSYKVENTEDTVVIVNSLKDAEKLKEELGKNSPLHDVRKMATRTPTITVTGLDKKYDPSEIVRMIKLQNKTIGDFLVSSTCEEDKKIDVVAVNPLKSNPSVYKAIVRVSNAIRELIQKQENRLFIGYKRVCNVWDSFYITRCFNCQQYGHNHKNCKNTTVCGHCAGTHNTRDCNALEDDSVLSCVNCKSVGGTRHDHAAYYNNCPVLLEHQKKLKSSIPFHQRRT